MSSCVLESDSLEVTNGAPTDISPRTYLKPLYFSLPEGLIFVDKLLPENPDFLLCKSNKDFPPEYFTNLYNHIKSFNVFNHLGARVTLSHNKINVSKFRDYLPIDYDDLVVLQYLEFGFPLGLVEDFVLVPNLRNHSSSYEYFSFVDKFVMKEIQSAGITGPFFSSPFP